MKYISKFLLWILGWKVMEPPVPEPKCIILGVPHTSGWDFVISYLYYRSLGRTASVMVKQSFFKGPLGPIVRGMGGIPVDRKRGASVTLQVIEEFKNREILHLAIAPEGTRKLTERWKAGFHTIATAANVPVYLGYFDWGKKEVGRGEKFELSNDAQADLKKIRSLYKTKGLVGKHPHNFTTGKDLE
ncbi:MAG: 1-acyl-sn-glycerol-3-phosphate acyltransferase [Bacteroidales bacterium]